MIELQKYGLIIGFILGIIVLRIFQYLSKKEGVQIE